MKYSMLISTLLLAVSAAATPAPAQDVVREVTVTEILAPDLNHYVGHTLFGWGEANLGVVSTANAERGIIGVTGRHGEFAMISASMLTHDGWTLHAPALTDVDIYVASNVQLLHPYAIFSL